MCSLGWKKIENKTFFGKNRNLTKEEAEDNIINSNNLIYVDNDVIGFGDKRYTGFWFGINKYGLSISSAYAQTYNNFVTGKKSSKINNFDVTEKVLRECKDPAEAACLYLQEVEGLERTYNIIIGGTDYAIALEIGNEKQIHDFSTNSLVRTNHPIDISKNEIDENNITSIKRLETLQDSIKCVNNLERLKDLLFYRGLEPSYNDIQKSGKIPTTATVAVEMKKNSMDITLKIEYTLKGGFGISKPEERKYNPVYMKEFSLSPRGILLSRSEKCTWDDEKGGFDFQNDI